MHVLSNRTDFYGLSRSHRSSFHLAKSLKRDKKTSYLQTRQEKGLTCIGKGCFSFWVMPPSEVIQLSETTSSGYLRGESRTISQAPVFLEVCLERDMSGLWVASIFLPSVLFVALKGHGRRDQEYKPMPLVFLFSSDKGYFSSMTLFSGRIGVDLGLICILDHLERDSLEKFVCFILGEVYDVRREEWVY